MNNEQEVEAQKQLGLMVLAAQEAGKQSAKNAIEWAKSHQVAQEAAHIITTKYAGAMKNLAEK